jgi:hypothetical protein
MQITPFDSTVDGRKLGLPVCARHMAFATVFAIGGA